MTADLILELVETALSMAHELDGNDVEKALLDIALTTRQAYEDHTGEELDPFEIEEEYPL